MRLVLILTVLLIAACSREPEEPEVTRPGPAPASSTATAWSDFTAAFIESRFKVMERKLFKLMTLAGIMAVTFGVSMLAVAPQYLLMRWLHLKLLLVLMLIAYHGACYALLQEFANDRNSHSERWYRVFNEIPALLLIGIVILVVVKPV